MENYGASFQRQYITVIMIGALTFIGAAFQNCSKVAFHSQNLSSTAAASAAGPGYVSASEIQPPLPQRLEVPDVVEPKNPATFKPTTITDLNGTRPDRADAR